MTDRPDAERLAMEWGSGKHTRPSLAGLLANHAPEARANARHALAAFFSSRFMTKKDMHTYRAQLARDMNARRREQGLRRVNGVPRRDLSCLADAIFAAIQFCGIANRLAGQSPSAVFVAACRERV